VEWRSPADPVRGPVVLVIDRPGGPMDRLVADPDVTTFLNDRFHAVFRTPLPGEPAGTLQFLDGCACPLSAPLAPATAAEFIATANALIVRPEAHACPGNRLPARCTPGQTAIPAAD
jgi:hypothetical protein